MYTHQIGDVIGILQKSLRQLYNPDELLTVLPDQIGYL